MSLKLDWCSYEAAKYAVEHWHYSRSMPRGKNVYIGAWEEGRYIGTIIFGTGAGAVTDGGRFGLAEMQMAELVRVALSAHTVPVSRCIRVAVKMLRANSPGLRLIVSFADPFHDHVGAIYQAAGWIYDGRSGPAVVYDIKGRIVHSRSFNGGKWMGAPKPIPANAVKVHVPGKYRYLYPLDPAMRAQILPLAKPYPKRPTSIGSDASGVQPEEGGAAPTVGLRKAAS